MALVSYTFEVYFFKSLSQEKIEDFIVGLADIYKPAFIEAERKMDEIIGSVSAEFKVYGINPLEFEEMIDTIRKVGEIPDLKKLSSIRTV